MSWRLKWACRQFADLSDYGKHSRTLSSATQFYTAVLRKLIPGLSSVDIMLTLKSGHVIAVREFMTLYIYKEVFVDGCYDVALDGPDPLILDIGANTGLFALRMKQLFPAAQITCYEPFPSNFEQLKKTIELNQLDTVTPLRQAMGAQAGSARLYVHKRNVGGHSFYAAEASSDEYVDVEVIELRTVLERLDRDVDLLKADCEGAEFEILMGLTKDQSQKVRCVIVEPTPKLYDITRLLEHVNDLGYARHWRDRLPLFYRSLTFSAHHEN